MTDTLDKLLRRKPRKKRPNLSLSSAGKCQRIAQYKILGAKEEPWGWRSRITLDDGDYGHDQLRKYMRKAFRTRTHFRLVKEEDTVYLNVSGTKIAGHIDGLITKICDCSEHKEWPRHTLLEVKTMSQYSYNYSKGGKISKDYLAQATAYMAALDITSCLFMLKNKSNGDFTFVAYERDEELLKEIFDRYKRILAFNRGGKTELDREYEPDEKGRLPFECNYCSYVLKCWKEYKPVKVGAGVRAFKVSMDDSFSIDDIKED